MKRMKMFFWALLGLVIILASSCREEADFLERSSYDASYLKGIKSHNFKIQVITLAEYGDLKKLKSAPVPDYLADGDTVFYKTSQFYKVVNGALDYQNVQFSWSDGVSAPGYIAGIDIIMARFYTESNGTMEMYIAGDSAGITLADTISLVCTDEYPFEPVNLNQLVDSVSYLGNGNFYTEWSWLSAWNSTPVGTIQANGCIGGSNTWATVDANVVNSITNPGYVTVGFTAKNSNLTTTPLGNIYWFVMHTVNNQWFTINQDRMSQYYLDTLIDGQTERTQAIGFIYLNGVPLPLSYVSDDPSGVASNDGRVMEDQDNLYIDFSGVTGDSKYIRAIDVNSSDYEDIPLTMSGGSMFAVIAKDSVMHEAGGLNWVMLKIISDGQEVDISSWSLYNDDPNIEALLFTIPVGSKKSAVVGGAWNVVQAPAPWLIVGLLSRIDW